MDPMSPSVFVVNPQLRTPPKRPIDPIHYEFSLVHYLKGAVPVSAPNASIKRNYVQLSNEDATASQTSSPSPKRQKIKSKRERINEESLILKYQSAFTNFLYALILLKLNKTAEGLEKLERLSKQLPKNSLKSLVDKVLNEHRIDLQDSEGLILTDLSILEFAKNMQYIFKPIPSWFEFIMLVWFLGTERQVELQETLKVHFISIYEHKELKSLLVLFTFYVCFLNKAYDDGIDFLFRHISDITNAPVELLGVLNALLCKAYDEKSHLQEGLADTKELNNKFSILSNQISRGLSQQAVSKAKTIAEASLH